ncbi:MAG: heme exporter protein CcmD [Gammaproteobacteria bacterium]|nr:heme exporter protein CcmD [Gammaproteobacteria bacterium]
MNPGFWAMGGYAVYVWPAYALGLAVLAWNWLVPEAHRRALLRRLDEDHEETRGIGT